MGSERRQNSRANISIDVDFKHESKLQKLYSRNLSKGGIYLSADKLVPIGKQVTIEFYVKELKKKFKVNAVVVHHHKFESFEDEATLKAQQGMGLKFIDLSKEDEKVIDDFILGKELKQGA